MKMKHLSLIFLLVISVVGGQLSCAPERLVLHNPASMQARVDSAALANGLVAKKITFRGPVTFTSQTGTGNTATMSATTTDNRKAGQRQGSAATAPNAVATTTTKKGGIPWWVFVLVGVAAIVAWEWLKSYLTPLKLFFGKR